MSGVLSWVQTILREEEFVVHRELIDNDEVIRFENDVVAGFATSFGNPDDLLTRWESLERSLLIHHAPSLRVAGDKAWNVYSVFLCDTDCESTQVHQIRMIEENLDRTRKIAACGLASREEVIRALSPILPLRYRAELQADDTSERFLRRLHRIAPRAAAAVLNNDIAPSDVVRLLGERE